MMELALSCRNRWFDDFGGGNSLWFDPELVVGYISNERAFVA